MWKGWEEELQLNVVNSCINTICGAAFFLVPIKVGLGFLTTIYVFNVVSQITPLVPVI